VLKVSFKLNFLVILAGGIKSHCTKHFFQVGCTAMLFHTGFTHKNWRELYKNLTILSSLDAYAYIEGVYGGYTPG